MRKMIKDSLESIITPLLAILLAFIVGAFLLFLAGNNPFEAYGSLLNGAFGSTHRLAETFVKAIPLIVLALGISVAFKAQIWNIGGDGQFTLGAICAVYVSLSFPLPNFILLPLSFLVAFLGGAIWGGIAGFLKAKFNANEVITTLMLNYIAIYLLEWLVKGPMMDPKGFGFPQTELVNEGLQLPIILSGTRLHAGLFVALILTIGVFLFWRSTTGFKIKIVGQSSEVARYCGIEVNKMIVVTMLLSAGMAGLAGWCEVMGVHYRLLENIAGGYGTLAVVVALLANLHPIGIVVSSFFFSALIVGGNTMQRMVGVPFSLVDVIQGLVIIFVISRVIYQKWRDKYVGKNIDNKFFSKLISRGGKNECSHTTSCTG